MMPGVTPIAVLGCGRIGRMHARGLARHPGAQLVSVYDVIPRWPPKHRANSAFKPRPVSGRC